MSIPLFGKMAKVGHIYSKNVIRPLTAAEKSVVYTLADEHGHIGAYAEIDVAELVYRTRFSRRSVLYALRSLEQDHGVTADRPEKQGRGQMTRYHLNEAAFVTVPKAQRVHYKHPKKGAPRAQKGAPGASPPYPVFTTKNKIPEAGALDPSSNEVEAGTSDRPDKAKPAGRKKPLPEDEIIEAITSLLMEKIKGVDPYLATGILADCRKLNPDVTNEQVINLISFELVKGVPASVKHPKAWIRHRTREGARKSYLAALDEAALRRRRSITEKKQ